MAKMCVILAIFVLGARVTSVQSYGPQLPPSKDKGCELTLGGQKAWEKPKEPEGHPLLLNASIRVYYLRDVPDSGGSFGVDLR